VVGSPPCPPRWVGDETGSRSRPDQSSIFPPPFSHSTAGEGNAVHVLEADRCISPVVLLLRISGCGSTGLQIKHAGSREKDEPTLQAASFVCTSSSGTGSSSSTRATVRDDDAVEPQQFLSWVVVFILDQSLFSGFCRAW
jgi:hypothetical protein